MSMKAALALQAAVYAALRESDGLAQLVGDAIFDAAPVTPPAGIHVALGAEDVRDAGDMTGGGSVHDIDVSVISGAGDGGFAGVKAAAAAVCEALEAADLAPEPGGLVGLWFLRSRARRIENGARRRVDLTFRARIDLGMRS